MSSRRPSRPLSPSSRLASWGPTAFALFALFALVVLLTEASDGLIALAKPLVGGVAERGFVLGLLAPAPLILIACWHIRRDSKSPPKLGAGIGLGAIAFVSLLFSLLFMPVQNRRGRSRISSVPTAWANRVDRELPGVQIGAMVGYMAIVLVPIAVLVFYPTARKSKAD